MLTRSWIGRRAACGVLAAILWPGPLRAQTTAQIPLQFDFMNPGARSLAMGSAFIGAADDATAAFSNPGGLPLKTAKPEVSVEGRFRTTSTPFLQGGRVNGVPTGVSPDTVANPIYGKDVDRHFGPAFLSVVVPLRSIIRHQTGPAENRHAEDPVTLPMVDRWTFAGYRHEVVSVTNTFFSSGPFERTTFAGVTDDRNRNLPVGGTRSVDIRNYGAAAGYRSAKGSFGVGGGVSVYTMGLEAQFARYNLQSSIYSEPDRSRAIATAVQKGDDTSVSVNAGAVWVLAPRFQVGVTYRRGPRFEFTQQDQVVDELELTRSGRFKVPDVAGVGISWQVTEELRAVADYDRVRYSQLKRDFIDIQAISTGRQDQLTIDDGNELHGGLEYVFLQAPIPFALRGGVWFDPAHAVRYVPTGRNDATDALLSAALTGGKDLVHGTGGAGVALSDHLEINGAADVTSQTIYVVVSAVIRF